MCFGEHDRKCFYGSDLLFLIRITAYMNECRSLWGLLLGKKKKTPVCFAEAAHTWAKGSPNNLAGDSATGGNEVFVPANSK